MKSTNFRCGSLTGLMAVAFLLVSGSAHAWYGWGGLVIGGQSGVSSLQPGGSIAVSAQSNYTGFECRDQAEVFVSGACRVSNGVAPGYTTTGVQVTGLPLTCGDSTVNATIQMNAALPKPTSPCVVSYRAGANDSRIWPFSPHDNCAGWGSWAGGWSHKNQCDFKDAYQTIKFIPAITASAPTYAKVGSSFEVSSTEASSIPRAISVGAGCSGSGTDSATITMGPTKGSICTVTYATASDAAFIAGSTTTSTRGSLWQPQSITFPAQTSPRLYVASGTFPITPATGGLSVAPIVYSSLSPSVCTVSGTTVTMVSTGTCVIAADKGADDDYAPAPQQVQFVEITKAQQWIRVDAGAPQTKPDGQGFTVAATSIATASGNPTGLAVNITVQGSCTGAGGNSPQTFTMNTNPPGVCTVIFQQGGNATYDRADPVTQYVTLDNGGSGCFGEGTYTSLRFTKSGGYIGWACNAGSFIAPGGLVKCLPGLYLPFIHENGWSIPPGIGFKGHVLQTELNPGKTFVIQKAPGWNATSNDYYNILNVTDKTCLASGNAIYEAWSPRVGSNSSAGYLVAFQDSNTMPGQYCNYSHRQTKWKINSHSGYITLQTAGYPGWPTPGCIGTDLFGLSRLQLWGKGSGNFGNWGDVWVRNLLPSCNSSGARITCGGYTPPTPNHLRFEFNSTSALTCQAMPITIRLCANAAPGLGSSGVCTPYNGYGVIKPLASAGTWSGLTLPPLTGFMSSSTGITLSNASTDTVSLGYSNKSMVLADNALECYDTASNQRVNCSAAFTYKKCADFDAVEPGAATGTNLYTKIAGRSFSFDVVGAAAYTGNVTVSLVDVTSSAACAGAPTLVSVAAPYEFVAGDNGRKTFNTSYAGAASNVAVKMEDKNGKCYASSDTFSIRPKVFDLTGTFDNPHKAGQPFSLVATAENDAGAVTTQYTATPAINDGAVMDITEGAPGSGIVPGSMVGTFPAAVAGVATGSNAFKYNNIGLLRFPQVADDSLASAVEDAAFTAVDQAKGDCIAGSYSNTLTDGKYGCNIGSTQLDTNRFIPDHYEVNYTLTPNCGGVTGFTYFDQAPATTPLVSVKAVSMDGGVLTRVTKDYPLPAVGSYSFTLTAKNGGIIANPPTAAPVSMRMSTVPGGGWPDTQPGGLYENLESYSATTALLPRQTPPVNYENFTLETEVHDPDDVKITLCNGMPVSGGGTTMCASPPVKFRHGILKLDAAYGPETLPLHVPVRALYWNGTKWARNLADNCTQLVTATANPARNIAVGNFKGGITSSDINVLGSGLTLNQGQGSIRIEAPGAGVQGSADIAINLNPATTANDSSCVSWGAGASAPNVTSGAALPFLKGAWCGTAYIRDPHATIRFGIPKRQVIFFRERY